jgi:hypothetical protein
MPKTGTSSIQASLHAARKTLLAKGVLYPPLGRNHSVRVFDVFADPGEIHPEHARRGRAHLPRDDQAAADRALLERLIDQNPDADLVLSGEGVALLGDAGRKRLLGFLQDRFESVQVVIFFRPPRSYIHSQAQQALKTGMTLGRLNRAEVRANYRRYAPYLDLQGTIRVTPVVFSAPTLVEGCAVRTFLSLTGLPDVPVQRRNDGLSVPAAELLMVANQMLPPLVDGRANPERAPGLREALRREPGPKFHPPRAVAERGLAASADEIAWLNARLGLEISAFDDAPDSADHHPGQIPVERRRELARQVREVNRRLLETGGASFPPSRVRNSER